MDHLRKYIGLYLTVLLLPFMFGYGVSEDHPIWVWWIAFGLVILKTPPIISVTVFLGRIHKINRLDINTVKKVCIQMVLVVKSISGFRFIILFRRSITIINRLYYITSGEWILADRVLTSQYNLCYNTRILCSIRV